tara:strand:+ start:2373 stop:2801 length:429 start_codon:yes stop_codon:yes gene_type:complete
MAIIKRRKHNTSEKNNTTSLVSLKQQLQACRKSISDLKLEKKNSHSLDEKQRLDQALNSQYQRKDKILAKLSNLGYQDKRGRPKKIDNEKYEHSRSKFTAMLNTQNLEYLKSLKSNNQIENISALLDELIEDYKSNNLYSSF